MQVRIRDARTMAGITQEELASALGVKQSTLSGYERGVHDPKSEQLSKIASVCGVTVDYLLCRGELEDTSEPEDLGQEKMLEDILTNYLLTNGYIKNKREIRRRDRIFLQSVARMLDCYFEPKRKAGRQDSGPDSAVDGG